ncbi:CvpA family protein [Spirochaeta lutea]|uniref:CvpA family protein n=1 Tax=Spirochaeta lutea TaxID=1480694 RepID=UPI000689A4E1|nr:CvpA family protein [Spirochaeta lutea]
MNFNITTLDVVLLIITGLAGIRAVFRGFVKELMSVGAVILGILLAMIFSGVAAVFLEQWLGQSVWTQVASFLGIFVLVYLVLKLFEAGLNGLIERVNLQNLDKALGLFLGLIEGILLCFILLFIMQIQPFFEVQQILEESVIYGLLSPFFPYAAAVLNGGLTGESGGVDV